MPDNFSPTKAKAVTFALPNMKQEEQLYELQ